MPRSVREWVRDRATIGTVDIGGNGQAGPPPYRPPSPLDVAEEQRERMMERDALDEELEDLEEAREYRTLKRKQRLAQLRQEIEEGPTGGGNHRLESLVEKALKQSEETQKQLLEEMRSRRETEQLKEIKALTEKVGGLEKNLLEIRDHPRGDDRASLVRDVIELFKVQNELRDVVRQQTPNDPQNDPGWSRDQLLRRIELDEEVAIRKAELADRREEREARKQQARDDAAIKRERLNRAFSGLEPVAEMLAAIVGGKVQGAIGGGNGAAPPGIASPEAAPPPPPPPLALLDWQCLDCNFVNQNPPGTEIALCRQCGTAWRPFGGEPTDHRHEHGGAPGEAFTEV